MAPRKPVSCGPIGPGPNVALKPVLGCYNHCLTKVKNPCYSIGIKTDIQKKCFGPGPAAYMLPSMKPGNISMGQRTEIGCKFQTPGPYLLPDLKCGKPGFTIGSRTKLKGVPITPGPYPLYEPKEKRGFTFGTSSHPKPPTCSPGPYDMKFTLVEWRAPTVVFPKSFYRCKKLITPGPTDVPKYEPKPAFSFGIKHSPCSRPYFTEQEDKCP